jgi:hypothetical protein
VFFVSIRRRLKRKPQGRTGAPAVRDNEAPPTLDRPASDESPA